VFLPILHIMEVPAGGVGEQLSCYTGLGNAWILQLLGRALKAPEGQVAELRALVQCAPHQPAVSLTPATLPPTTTCRKQLVAPLEHLSFGLLVCLQLHLRQAQLVFELVNWCISVNG
jgi:hypothetical protein